jgi:hypothetical protein
MKVWRIIQVAGVLVLTVGILLRIGDQAYGTMVAAIGALAFVLGWVVAWLNRRW